MVHPSKKEMDEPIPLLYYDDEDNIIQPTSLFPEDGQSGPSEFPSTSSVAPSLAPIGRDVLPDVVFDDTTTRSQSDITGLAPIIDWNNNNGKGRR